MKNNHKDFKVKQLKKDDLDSFRELIHLFAEVFENDTKTIPRKKHLRKILNKPDFIAIVATHKGKVIGGLTAFILPKYYTEESELFIYDVAISPNYQRKGLGKSLLTHLKELGKKKGISEIFVAANIEDKHALDFYHSTGGKAEKVVHFNYEV